MITVKYQEIINSAFAQTIQKIASTPTHGNVAAQIHKVVKAIELARDQIRKDYQAEIAEKFGKKDEAGKLIRPEDEPNGFDVIEGKEEEMALAQEALNQKSIDLDCPPFTLQLFGDMKISAMDLEVLKGLYAGNQVTGQPSNVIPIKQP